MSVFAALVSRDLRLAFRHGGDTLMAVIFFLLVVVLFPLAVGPEAQILKRIASGVIWVAALLASVLSLDRLFHQDFEDGSLDLIVLSPLPLELAVLAKALAHWLTTGLPLIIVSPLLGLFLGLQASAYPVLLAALALGTPTLSLVGAIGAALALGARRGGTLISLLILPLLTPVLIFGVGAVDAAVLGFPSGAQFLVLGGLLLAALALCPWAGAAALRQAVQ